MKHIVKIICAICISLSVHSRAAEPAVGSAMPKLSELLPKSALPKTSGKVVLVDFWASWCAPCKASFSTMAKLHERYAAQGLVIIAIGVDEEADKYQAFAAKHPVGFTLVHDARQTAASFFNPPTMPTSYLIDRSGRIQHIHKGFDGAKTEAQYIQEIEELLRQ